MADDPKIRDLALRGLDVTAQVDDLSIPKDAQNLLPSISDLYQHIIGSPRHNNTRILSLIQRNPHVARDFENLLKKMAYANMPKLAAASGSSVRQREHDGYVLKLTESTVEPEQLYLSIETGLDVVDQPNRLFLKTVADDWLMLDVPPMTNGRAQWALDKSAPEVQAFGQPDTVIYIR